MTCPSCGASNLDESKFCKSCGVEFVEVADTTTDGGSSTVLPPRRAWRRRTGIAAGAVFVLGLVGVGAYFAGVEAGDDSEQVAALSDELSSTTAKLDQAESTRDGLESQVDDLQADNRNLTSRLEAETGLSGSDLEPPDTGSGPSADYSLNSAVKVQDLILKPTALEVQSEGSGRVIYLASLTVKNDGNASVSPFCGGSDSQLLDTAGRRYDGEAVLSFSSANCSDLQPGLTKDNFHVRFTLPPDAEPAVLRLSGDSYGGPYESWYVK